MRKSARPGRRRAAARKKEGGLLRLREYYPNPLAIIFVLNLFGVALDLELFQEVLGDTPSTVSAILSIKPSRAASPSYLPLAQAKTNLFSFIVYLGSVGHNAREYSFRSALAPLTKATDKVAYAVHYPRYWN